MPFVHDSVEPLLPDPDGREPLTMVVEKVLRPEDAHTGEPKSRGKRKREMKKEIIGRKELKMSED